MAFPPLGPLEHLGLLSILRALVPYEGYMEQCVEGSHLGEIAREGALGPLTDMCRTSVELARMKGEILVFLRLDSGQTNYSSFQPLRSASHSRSPQVSLESIDSATATVLLETGLPLRTHCNFSYLRQANLWLTLILIRISCRHPNHESPVTVFYCGFVNTVNSS